MNDERLELQEVKHKDTPRATDPPGAGWALQLLGGLSCRHASLTVEKFATRKAALLLIRLGLAGGISIQRDELATLLWPDEPVDVSRPRLRQAVISLKRSFPDSEAFPLEASKNDVRFEDGAVHVDSMEFERLARGGNDEEAVFVYRPLLPGWTDPWIAPYRKRLEGLFVQAVLRLAEAAEPDRAIRILSEAYAVHPLNETLVSAYMTRLNRSGEQARSLQAYDHYVAMLDSQMGIGPGSAIRSLAEDAAATGARVESIPIRIEATALPRPLTRMFGREPTIDRLSVLVRGGRRLVTLTGIGGIGKTRVALEFSRRQDSFDPVAFVPFIEVSGNALVFEAVHAALGIPTSFRSDSAATLIKALANRRALLIFDGIEHLLPGVARIVGGLLAACPELTIIATSRVPLGIAGEQVMPIGPLADNDEAATMFLDRAALLSGASQSDSESRAAAERIAKDLDGIPLAIELAAAQAGLFSLREIETRLKDRLSFLQGGSDVVEPRHERLDEVLAWSIESLPTDTREVFSMLAVFHGTFTVESASAVYKAAAEKQIEELRRRALVVEAPSSGNRRFRMLETVREAAFALLAPDLAKVYRRDLRKCLIAFCNDQAERFQSVGTAALAHQALAEEFENVRDCMATALKEDPESGLELAIKHSVMAAGSGHVTDARNWLETYLLRRSWPPSNLAGRGFFQLAMSVGFFGHEDLELVYLRRSAEIAEASGADDLKALAGTNLALNLFWSGRLRDAIAAAEHAGSLWPPGASARLIPQLIIICAQGLLSDVDAARVQMRKLLELVLQLTPNAWIISESWFGMAHLALEAGDYDLAVTAAKTGHAVLEGGGYTAMAFNVLSFLARVLVAADRQEEAWQVIGQLGEYGLDRGIPAASVYCDYFTGLLKSDRACLIDAARGAIDLTLWSVAANALQALARLATDTGLACRYLSAARALRDEHGIDLSAAASREWAESAAKFGFANQPAGSLDELLPIISAGCTLR